METVTNLKLAGAWDRSGDLSGAPTAGNDDARPRPSAWRQVFASVLTPNWSLGLLLFVCLTLPSYRGCGNQVVYVGQVLEEVEPSPDSVYITFLVTWPYLFGLLVAGGTIWLALSGDVNKAGRLWWPLAALVVLNATLLVVAATFTLLTAEGRANFARDWQAAGWLIVPSAAALALVVFTRRRCRHPFTAAMWLQCGLAVLAAVSVSILTPGFLLAQEFLIGGKLAVACAVFLVLATVVAALDGQRALSRREGESPLQLSLRSLLILMLLGGVACCWVGTFLLVEIPVE